MLLDVTKCIFKKNLNFRPLVKIIFLLYFAKKTKKIRPLLNIRNSFLTTIIHKSHTEAHTGENLCLLPHYSRSRGQIPGPDRDGLGSLKDN